MTDDSKAASSNEPAFPQSVGQIDRMGLHPLLGLLVFSALFFAGLAAVELAVGGGRKFDSAILLALRTPGDLAKPIGPAWMLQSAIDLSALGGFTLIWLFTAASSGFLIMVRRWAALSLFLTAIVGASLLNAAFKFSFHRERPEVVPHLAEVSNSSFPSGHAMISAATYMTVGAMMAHTQSSRVVRIYILSLAVALSVLIGFSRLYLGVHWPSDVMAGWAFGSAWALLFLTIARKAEQGRDRHDTTRNGG